MGGLPQEPIGVTENITLLPFQALNIPDAAGTAKTIQIDSKDYVMSVVAVNGLSTTAITALGVPPGPDRGSQLLIGSAAGNVHYTPNAIPKTSAPAFVTRTFDGVGVGAIDPIGFAGSRVRSHTLSKAMAHRNHG